MQGDDHPPPPQESWGRTKTRILVCPQAHHVEGSVSARRELRAPPERMDRWTVALMLDTHYEVPITQPCISPQQDGASRLSQPRH